MSPRLNFEDSIFKDARFYKLVALCGNDLDTACGALLRAWSLAQKWFLTPSKMVPISEWEKQDMRAAIIESGMAVLHGDFVYVRGSVEQFSWLEKARESGKKGGKGRAKIIEEIPKGTLTDPKGSLTSSSFSSSFSFGERSTTTTKGLSGQVETAYGIWCQTLETFQIPATPMAGVQENSIARAITHLGFENVILALEGQRYEKPNDKFDPRRHLSVDRVLHRDARGKSRWEEFKNMALAVRSKSDEHEQARRDAEGIA